MKEVKRICRKDQHKMVDAQEVWQSLEAGVDQIMNRLNEGLSYQRYMELYTYIMYIGSTLNIGKYTITARCPIRRPLRAELNRRLARPHASAPT